MSGDEYRRDYAPPPGAIERARADAAAIEHALGRTAAQTDRSVVALEADGETICRSCGTPLIWAVRPGGQAVPINREPDPEGTCTVTASGDWQFGLDRIIPGQLSLDGDQPTRYRLHFEVCPDRDRWHRWGLARRRAAEAGDR